MEDGGGIRPEVKPTELVDPASLWQETREAVRKTPYVEHYQAAMDQFKKWESEPKALFGRDEWDSQVEAQLQKGKGLLSTYKSPQARISETNKIVTAGTQLPRYGNDTLTRFYVGVDPRSVADAYVALLQELEANGSLAQIETALNLDALSGNKLVGSAIVIYDPQSRPEVCGKVLQAYKAAKQKHEKLFGLSPNQKTVLMREDLRLFKAPIDANLSFVELPAEDSTLDYDGTAVAPTLEAFGITRGVKGITYTDEQWLATIKRSRVKYVYTRDAQAKRKTGVRSGDTFAYKRDLSAPALVQYGTVTIP